MRTYIFSFPQTKAIKLGLKLNELLLLDYLYKLFNTGLSKVEVRGKKHYYKITYKKILGDLPILGIKERRLRVIIVSLEKKGVVKRLREDFYEMYISVNFGLLEDERNGCCSDDSFEKDKEYVLGNDMDCNFLYSTTGTKVPIDEQLSALKCRTPSTKVPTIDNINKNKILKIRMNKENACATHDININITKFNEIMHSYIDKRFSQITKDMYLKRFRLLLIVDEMMLFESDYLHVLEANFKTKIEDIANLVLEDLRQD